MKLKILVMLALFCVGLFAVAEPMVIVDGAAKVDADSVDTLDAGKLTPASTMPALDANALTNLNVTQTSSGIDGRQATNTVDLGGNSVTNGTLGAGMSFGNISDVTNRIPYWDGAEIQEDVLLSWEPVSRTITLTNTMTSTTIQEEIDKAGKYIPEGVQLTFQFGDGTYSITNALLWEGFFGGGLININGNTGEPNAADLHTTQLVYLDGDGGGCDVVKINHCQLFVNIRNLKVEADTASGDNCIYVNNVAFANVRFNYCLGDGMAEASGVYCRYTHVQVEKTYVSNMKYGIFVRDSTTLFSRDNDETGTDPQYGLRTFGATIMKFDATQPAGSIANEIDASGGVTR